MAGHIVSVLSEPRLGAFGAGVPGFDPVEVVAGHGRNIALCEALYPALHLLEVAMRNRIHDSFRTFYANDEWFNEGWLVSTHAHVVADARQKLVRRGRPCRSDNIVSELNVGFWCGMFSNIYEMHGGPWPTLLASVVPRVPKSWRTRDKISGRVEEARRLRDRVFHHDSISHYADLYEQHRSLVELLGWFSRDARDHLEHLCRFKSVLAENLKGRSR